MSDRMATRGVRAATAIGVLVIAAVVVATFWERPSDDASPSIEGSVATTTTSRGASSEQSAPTGGLGLDGVERLGLRVVATVAHDPTSFTQGLVVATDGRLYESAGQYGESDVREVDPATGRVLREVPLPDEVFGEGLAIGPDGLVQLSWREGRAFRWRLEDLGALGEWRYEGEGWGLTYDPEQRVFLRSDGSHVITRHDPQTFEELGRIEVTRAGQPVDQLNELELVEGLLYANVWKSTEILRIDPASGEVRAVIDATDLVPALDDPEAVLNGIAHRPGDRPERLYLTGKDWPVMYLVDVVSR